MVVESGDLPADVAERIGVVERNAFRLRSLVENLLQVVQGAGALPITRTDADLSQVVAEALEAARPAASRGRGRPRDRPPASTCPRWSTRAGSAQVLDTLVSNGIARRRDPRHAPGQAGPRRRSRRADRHRRRPRHRTPATSTAPSAAARPRSSTSRAPGSASPSSAPSSRPTAARHPRPASVGVGSVVRVSLPHLSEERTRHSA